MSVSTQAKTTTDDRIENIPREPSEFRPTTHFGDRYKWRNMKGEWIADLIQNGETVPETEVDCANYPDSDEKFHFIRNIEFRGESHEFHLVVYYESRDIRTIYIPGFKNDDYRERFPSNR